MTPVDVFGVETLVLTECIKFFFGGLLWVRCFIGRGDVKSVWCSACLTDEGVECWKNRPSSIKHTVVRFCTVALSVQATVEEWIHFSWRLCFLLRDKLSLLFARITLDPLAFLQHGSGFCVNDPDFAGF